MRGDDIRSGTLFSYVDLEERVPTGHALRLIGEIVSDVLSDLSAEFSAMYSHTGRPSIAPEKLLRALLLQAFYSIRSERQLMEQLNFNLLFRWFVGLGLDDRVWDATVFCKNRDRLLDAHISHKFLAAIIAHKKVARLLSHEHFSVDGTLVEAWASMKSFVPKDDDGPKLDDTGSSGGRNAERDFRGQRRKNDTHASTTDPDARLYKKGSGKSARLCFMGHALMENRNGLAVGAMVTSATGTAEREAALALMDAHAPPPGATQMRTLGADKGYDAWRFRKALRDRSINPHVAHRKEFGWGGQPITTTPGHQQSQRSRKRIEEIFGWVKTIAGQAKTAFTGRQRVEDSFTLSIAAYNLIRLPKLLADIP
jgi:transposase